MEAVKAFNLELTGLYEVKPPISKAKMTCITKGAIKGIKLYKHVVQSVEKFIQKCKPEYKVPGLYVIDSIVRQSRHQFGPERDVFAPRFAKNIQVTFMNLFKCPEEEKSKVIRVLNLWQKNHVFPSDVIQPLFDLADPNHPVYNQNSIQSNGIGNQSVGVLVKGSPAIQKSPAKASSQVSYAADSHLGNLNTNNLPDSNTFTQLQQFHKTLHKQGGDSGKIDGPGVRFDRKLLDFDYDDDEEDDLHHHINPSPKLPPHNISTSSALDTVGSLLSNPEVLRQLQTLQQTMSQSQQYPDIDIEKLRKLQEMKQQEEEFDKHLAQTVPNLPFAAECDLKSLMNPPAPSLQPYYMTGFQDIGIPPPGYKQAHPIFEPPPQDLRNIEPDMHSREPLKETPEIEVINLDQGDSRSQTPNDERFSNRRKRSRSRERSRERMRGKERERRSKRSRTRSHSKERRRRTRSRDRVRDRDREREREKEKEREKERDREKEKERRKRGLPPLKKEYLCVCSTTLWVGHLSKLVHQEELSDAFGEYGGIVSIDLIPPRGCAFIVMHRRQDAARCLEKLKNYKLQGKAITLAWAPGKGLKGKDLKDYWEVDLGVSYIPWSKLKPNIDVELLEDGGMIDEDSMPDWLKAKISQLVAPVMASPQISLLSTMPGMNRSSLPPSLANLDTSQPPPIPGQMLQPPPTLPLQMVNPFQLNLGMNMPHSMMPAVPIGVPPPNIPPPSMMSNQLLGFPQPATQNLLPPPISMPPATKPPLIQKPMTSFPVMQMPPLFPEDHMDVEMEDVDKLNKPPALSDQLLACLGHTNDATSLSAAVSRLNAVTSNRNDDSSIGAYYDRISVDYGRNVIDERSQFSDGRKNGSRENRDRKENRDQGNKPARKRRINRWEDKYALVNETYDKRPVSEDISSDEKTTTDTHQDPQVSNKTVIQILNEDPVVTFEPPPPDQSTALLTEDVFASRFSGDQNDDINAFINPEPPSDTFLQQSGDEIQTENFDGHEWQSNQQNKWSIDNVEERQVNFVTNIEWQSNQKGGWTSDPADDKLAQNFSDGNDWQSNQSEQWPNNTENEQIQSFESDNNWQTNQRNEWHNSDATAEHAWKQPNLTENSQEKHDFSMHSNQSFESKDSSLNQTESARGHFDYNNDDVRRTSFISVRKEIFLKDERFLQNDNNFNTEGNVYESGVSDLGARIDPLLGNGPIDSRYEKEVTHGDFKQQDPAFEDTEKSGPEFEEPIPYTPPQFEMPSLIRSEYNDPDHGHEFGGMPDRLHGGGSDHGFGGSDYEQHEYESHRGGSDYGFGGPGSGPEYGRTMFGKPEFDGPEHGRPFFGQGFRGRDMRRGKRGFAGPRADFWPARNMRGGDGFHPRGRGGVFHLRGQQSRGTRPYGPRWNDGGERKFQARFDGLSDHSRGSKFEDRTRRGSYDDPRTRYNKRDREDRRQHRNEFEDQPRERRSRWGSSPPKRDESYYNENNSESISYTDENNSKNVANEEFTSEQVQGDDGSNYDVGNSTPLRDEPQEPEIVSDISETAVQSVVTEAPATEDQQ